jgi:hypothetical protein
MPGLRILRDTFWLLAGNAFTLFRLTWLPIVVMIAAQVALGQAVAQAGAFAAEPAFFLGAALQVIALSAAAVRVHELVLLDERRPGQYFAFPFGRTEAWYALMVLALIGVSVGITVWAWPLYKALIEANLPVQLYFPGEAERVLMNLLLFTPLVWAFLWFCSRVGLWPPAVVATRGFALAHAWQVTRGQAVPMYLVVLAGGQFVGLAIYVRAFAADPLRMSEFLDKMSDQGLRLSWRIDPIAMNVFPSAQRYAVWPAPEQVALDFALTFFVLCFMAALTSFAYLSLTREEDSLSFGSSTAS